MDRLDSLKSEISKVKYYSDLWNIPWKLYKPSELKRKYYKNKTIGLFNVPCGGFGDIILTKTFHDMLKDWYPGAKIKICTTGGEKYKSVGIKDNLVKLVRIDGSDYDDGECSSFDKLKLQGKHKFDIMIILPIINYVFNYNKFKKLIPYSNYFNTFTMSEYNGEFPPYTYPIGVGKDNLGILFNNFKIKQQKLITGPYALVYIQPSPAWGPHSRYCFLSYLEMICAKYSKKHKNFQIVIPNWIHEDLNDSDSFYNKIIKITKKYYTSLNIKYPNDEVILYGPGKDSGKKLTLRGDILPQKREIFISIMKDSVKDILVTGDQSLTDIISCCKYKTVWYQIAPWKKGLANQLSNYFKFFNTYKTSCGTLKAIDLNVKVDWKDFMSKYDFRINGKKRTDSILIANYFMKQDKKLFDNLLLFIQKSRKKHIILKKINNLFNKDTKKKMKKTIRKTRKKTKRTKNKI
tara:strand:- start:613 stop:1998 length:1386 start_codon:yes stop_codon:yes gene_type:complete